MAADQCTRCIFRFAGKMVCVAFPKGIPVDLVEGGVDHTKPYVGDGGIRFVPSREYDRHPSDPEGMNHLGFGQ